MSHQKDPKAAPRTVETPKDEKPLAISKMDKEELGDYLEKVSGGVASHDAKQIRICECCILIAEA
jgi:hypothetical protein